MQRVGLFRACLTPRNISTINRLQETKRGLASIIAGPSGCPRAHSPRTLTESGTPQPMRMPRTAGQRRITPRCRAYPVIGARLCEYC